MFEKNTLSNSLAVGFLVPIGQSQGHLWKFLLYFKTLFQIFAFIFLY